MIFSFMLAMLVKVITSIDLIHPLANRSQDLQKKISTQSTLAFPSTLSPIIATNNTVLLRPTAFPAKVRLYLGFLILSFVIYASLSLAAALIKTVVALVSLQTVEVSAYTLGLKSKAFPK
jgi:hypothetical protein